MNKNFKILLISGHGAGDVGACGCGYQEYALTRELTNLVAKYLREYATVDIYNQNRNAFYDCQNGTFNIGKYDYVLEIHFNAFNGQAYGTEIFVTSSEKYTTVEQEIMNNMGEFFVKRGGTGVKVTDFLVIRTIKNRGISSALIETCFIDNAKDMATYKANMTKIAIAIVNGMVKGFGLGELIKPVVKPAPEPEPKTVSIDELAREVIAGQWGNGDARKKNLTAKGYDYAAVQARVDEILLGKTTTAKPATPAPKPVVKTVDQLAQEVIDGKYGTGEARKKSLGARYAEVQARVNEILTGTKTPTATPKMTARQFAIDVWYYGKYGSGETRKANAKKLGVNYNEAQRLLNILASGGKI